MKNNLYELNSLEEFRESKDFWMKRIPETFYDQIIPYGDSNRSDYEEAVVSVNLEKQLSQRILNISGDVDLLTYIIMMSAFQVQIYRYINEECVINIPTYEEDEINIENIANNISLPFKIPINENMSIKEIIGFCKQELIGIYKNQYYPLETFFADLEQEKTSMILGQFSLCMKNLHNNKRIEELISIAKKQINICIEKQDDNISLEVLYNANLYKEDTIKRLINRYSQVLDIIVNNIDAKVYNIDILTEEEKHEILYRFNNTKREYPKYKTIKEIFEEKAEWAGEKIAVVSNEVELSYQELNQRANQLARVLRKKGITRDSIVPVLCDKSVETIVAMVAVIKAGGAYLPIDEEYPEARIRYLLEDSGCAVLLGKKEAIHKLNLTEISVEVVDLTDEEVKKESKENLTTINVPEDLAYVIYTSGTTGNPKGVSIENRSLIKIIINTNYITISKDDKLLQSGSLSFDASVQQIWLALLHGIPLHMEDKELMLEIDQLEEYILNNNITLIIFPTTLFNQISQERIEAFEKIKYVIAGGDIISSQQVSRLIKTYKDIKVVNGYGPTENTIISTAYIMTDEWDENKNVPIGKPVTNSTAYIMDKHNKLLPIGVPGELCVGGDGVARGYLNREDLTNEKFILNPYVEGERIYKTGDLARWLPDGNLEFLGRIDHQVKIRGYRIELGEIEKQLIKHFAVKEAVVIDRKSDKSEKYLCGYIVGEDDISTQEIKEELKKELPDYMIPTYIMQLEKLPLTPNGKIDKKALPEPNLSSIENEYVAPRNEIETIIARVWCEVLGVEKIGIYNSFFDTGGDSIKSIQIVSRLRRNGIKLEVKDIMQHKTIAEIAKYAKNTETIVSQEVVEGEIELTPIIKQFIETDKNIFNHFNQSMMLYSKDGFDEQIVKVVMEQIVKHHDALRMVLKYDEEISGYNKGIDTKLFDLHLVDLTETTEYKQKIEEMAQKLQESIKVDSGPLVKVGVFKTSEGDHLLLIIHHLAVDGVSWRILLEDFAYGYQAVKEGNEIRFPQKTTSFKEWAEKQYEYANGSKILKELKYWEQVSRENLGQIPREVQNEPVVVKDMVTKNITLGKELTTQLLQETNRAYNTEINDVLLSALGMAVKEWSGMDRIAITLEGHGREEIIDEVDITRTVGWFTSCYPVVLNMEDEDIGMAIKRNKESLRRVPNKGVGYGMLKYLTEEGVNGGINLQTDISFNYLGQFDEDTNNGVLKYSNLSCGKNASSEFPSMNSIQINSMIKNKRLIVTIDFDEKAFTKQTINEFVNIYKETLNQTIQHCVEKKEREYTPSDYGVNEYTLEDVQEIHDYVKENIGKDVVINKINKLTPMQEGMLFTYLQEKDTTAYVVQTGFKIKGYVDVEILTKTYHSLLKRHEILRTTIFNYWKHPSQIIFDNREQQVEFLDLTQYSNKEERYKNYTDEMITKGFDLNRDLLFKVSLIKMDTSEYRLIVTCHHIIIDGWSNAIILNDLFEIYQNLATGKNIELRSYEKYDTYIQWLFKQDKNKGLEYWKEYLRSYDKSPFTVTEELKFQEYNASEVDIKLSRDLTKKLENVCSQNEITFNTLCQTAWGLLLQKHTGYEDIVFGAIVSGRPPEIKGIEKMVGNFLNTLPVRVRSESTKTVGQLMKEIQDKSSELKPYEYLPLADIQNLSILKQNLIQTLMVFENYPVEDLEKNINGENKLGFVIEEVFGREETNYNLNVIFILREELTFKIMYNENVYSTSMINRLSSQLIVLFEKIAENVNELVDNMELISEEEKEKMNSLIQEYEKDILEFGGIDFDF
ncbi:non-ribosomal peptide synthetase [Bacillus cereus]|uniref:Amino acid adenylation domain-containing protein n=1 Tax=Bacillus cereus HuA2-1 TaxID=1053201 RepID=J9CRA4_BACCE|nr:non-ribosomal peptide synthetase [Bacillus cereus]EJV87812.1 amino acid adenylation domain-containing protein [Bacillus cereus HuA2-1]